MIQAGSPSRRLVVRGLAVLLALLVLDQIALRVLVQSDRIFGVPLLPYFSFEFKAEQIAPEVPVVFDQELGWRLAKPDEGGDITLDWTGARLGAGPLPARKKPGVTRILLLGGSIALGSHLPNEATFAAMLDMRSQQYEVINFSTPLYGLDQSLLRLRADGFALRPDEVWLAFEPETALVATTRYLPLVRRTTGENLFKPRFQLHAADELALLPTPGPTEAEAESVIHDHARYLAEFAPTEMWASNRGPFAIPGLGEQFFLTKFVASQLLSRQFERDMRLADSESLAFRTLVALAVQLEQEVSRNGVRLRVLMLPNKATVTRNVFLSEPQHTLFANELRSYGLEVIEFALSPNDSEHEDAWFDADHEHVSYSLQRVLAQDR